jgi:protein-S-isoprenylcysteine O-methyltransferase Ste14
LNPLHLVSRLVIGGGFILLAAAWRVLYAAQQTHQLATTGPYAYVRHPQYDGFILITQVSCSSGGDRGRRRIRVLPAPRSPRPAVGQSWFHTLNLEPIRATGPMSAAMFFLGLVTSVIVSWVGTYVTAELYRRWAPGEAQ